jgi:hypothetical protein
MKQKITFVMVFTQEIDIPKKYDNNEMEYAEQLALQMLPEGHEDGSYYVGFPIRKVVQHDGSVKEFDNIRALVERLAGMIKRNRIETFVYRGKGKDIERVEESTI